MKLLSFLNAKSIIIANIAKIAIAKLNKYESTQLVAAVSNCEKSMNLFISP